MRVYLDTSNQFLIINIKKGPHIIKSYFQKIANKQTELAVPTVNKLLKEVGLNLQAVTELVISSGPGSFTGIRVAITFAKTLATLNPNLKIYTINSLLLQAGLNTAISVITAYGGKSYLAVYSQGKIIIPAQLVNDQTIAGIVADLNNFDLIRDYQLVDIEKNISDLDALLVAINALDELKPIYIGDNFIKINTTNSKF